MGGETPRTSLAADIDSKDCLPPKTLGTTVSLGDQAVDCHGRPVVEASPCKAIFQFRGQNPPLGGDCSEPGNARLSLMGLGDAQKMPARDPQKP